MKKKEWLYREILYMVLEKKEHLFTQKALAKKCEISIGNVNKALKPLEDMNAIEKKPRGLRIISPKKILLYWASIRNLRADIYASLAVRKNVTDIEKELPPVKFTAYSGYRFRFKETPTDYSEVVVYGDPEKIKSRFRTSKSIKTSSRTNIIVLKTDPHLSSFKQVPIAQLFVDLWNLDTWYADEFLNALEKKINKIIELYTHGAG